MLRLGLDRIMGSRPQAEEAVSPVRSLPVVRRLSEVAEAGEQDAHRGRWVSGRKRVMRWLAAASVLVLIAGGALWWFGKKDVIAGKAAGRHNGGEITLFDSVGFAIEDFSALRYVREQLARTGLYEELDLLADPDEPRDLYGMLLRAAKSAPAAAHA